MRLTHITSTIKFIVYITDRILWGDTMKKLILLITLTLTMMFGQTKLETRLYELSYNMAGYTNEMIDIESITGFDLEIANVYIFDVKNLQADDPQESNIYLQSRYYSHQGDEDWAEGQDIRLVGNGINDVNFRFGF